MTLSATGSSITRVVRSCWVLSSRTVPSRWLILRTGVGSARSPRAAKTPNADDMSSGETSWVPMAIPP